MADTDWDTLMDQAGSFEQLSEPGDYDVEVVVARHKNNGQKDMYNVCFQVISGPNKGESQWNNFVISPESPAALGFFFRHMAALGLDQEFFKQKPTHDQVCDALMGARATISVDKRGGTGQYADNMDVKGVRAMEGGDSSAPPPPPTPEGPGGNAPTPSF